MKKILSYIMVALFTIGTAMNVSAAEPEQRLSEYNAKSVVIIDTNLKTGEVTSYQTHAKQTYNRLKTRTGAEVHSISAEVFIPLKKESGLARDNSSLNKTEAGVTATVTANYSVTDSSGSYTWYSYSGSWVPSDNFYLLSNRSCGAVEYYFGKGDQRYPNANSFSYTLNWKCIRAGENPRVWSRATITPIGMGDASHIIDLYMEF